MPKLATKTTSSTLESRSQNIKHRHALLCHFNWRKYLLLSVRLLKCLRLHIDDSVWVWANDSSQSYVLYFTQLIWTKYQIQFALKYWITKFNFSLFHNIVTLAMFKFLNSQNHFTVYLRSSINNTYFLWMMRPDLCESKSIYRPSLILQTDHLLCI